MCTEPARFVFESITSISLNQYTKMQARLMQIPNALLIVILHFAVCVILHFRISFRVFLTVYHIQLVLSTEVPLYISHFQRFEGCLTIS